MSSTLCVLCILCLTPNGTLQGRSTFSLGTSSRGGSATRSSSSRREGTSTASHVSGGSSPSLRVWQRCVRAWWLPACLLGVLLSCCTVLLYAALPIREKDEIDARLSYQKFHLHSCVHGIYPEIQYNQVRMSRSSGPASLRTAAAVHLPVNRKGEYEPFWGLFMS